MKQGIALIESIGVFLYSNPKPPFLKAGVGSHFRHCIDFYNCFLTSVEEGRINYALRKRSQLVETDTSLAITEIEAIIQSLARLSFDDCRNPVQVIVEDSSAAIDSSSWGRSSVTRELQHRLSYVALLALKYRSLTLFTSANPAIVGGGFVGESKAEILRGLSNAKTLVARASLIESPLDTQARVERAKSFMAANGLSFPIVLKPDMGQRGSGVAVVKSEVELKDYLCRSSVDTVIQEHVPGFEFGVFYYRHPTEDRGRIFSITEKRFPILTGDGENSLEHLILKDERAVCMARFYLDKQGEHLLEVPLKGESVQLVELGTHCRGAIFLDGGWVKTVALEEAFDDISKGFEGFYFGRFDVRTPSADDFMRGKNFKIIELNGVTSEATHIYDPKNSLPAAYKVLFEQWRLAFEIGAENRERGVNPASISTLVRLMSEYRQSAQFHPA